MHNLGILCMFYVPKYVAKNTSKMSHRLLWKSLGHIVWCVTRCVKKNASTCKSFMGKHIFYERQRGKICNKKSMCDFCIIFMPCESSLKVKISSMTACPGSCSHTKVMDYTVPILHGYTEWVLHFLVTFFGGGWGGWQFRDPVLEVYVP